MKMDKELAVGIFLIIGILSEFEDAGGVKPGASVEIAGVQIGKVKNITLDNYQALVEFTISKNVEIQEDAIASIKTKGLIGEKYVQISPGGSEKFLRDGEKIRETESAIDVEELISKYVFGKV